jgi:hypothetical protein
MRSTVTLGWLILAGVDAPAQTSYPASARHGPIVVDGISETEWSEMPSAPFFDGSEAVDGLSWQMSFDQSYYYFRVEAAEESVPIQTLRLYLYGSNPCAGLLPEAIPENAYTVRWHRDGGWAFYETAVESGFWQAGEVTATTSSTVVAANVSEDGPDVWEMAVPASWIGSELGAGGDFHWSQPILAGLRLWAGENGTEILHWPVDLALETVCQLGRVDLADGWPQDALWGSETRFRFEPDGGTASTMISVPEPEATVAALGIVPEWIHVSVEGRGVALALDANTGRHRRAFLELATQDEVAAGVLTVEQWGTSGTPWDFDFVDPLTSMAQSDWFGAYTVVDPSKSWLYSYEQGWVFFVGLRGQSVHFYDYTLGAWWWTAEDVFPWLYLWKDSPGNGWYYALRSYAPAFRWFYRAEFGEWLLLPERKQS